MTDLRAGPEPMPNRAPGGGADAETVYVGRVVIEPEPVEAEPVPPPRHRPDAERTDSEPVPRRNLPPQPPLFTRHESTDERAARSRTWWAPIVTLAPVLPVLAAQAVLCYRLIHLNTAFLDESTYLVAGHQEIGHVVHGHSVAPYETYFSGAPVLYPVLVAVADHFGGLTGARLLSLAFMLLATVALYLATRRMFGVPAGFIAAALFVALGPTQFVGSFSTYDGMALCLLAWAAYQAVRLAYGDSRNALTLGAVFMVLADFTKYASLLWNPVVLGIVAFAGPATARRASRSWDVQRFLLVAVVLGGIGVVLGREPYYNGFMLTTASRKAGTATTRALLTDSAHWVGVVVALAALAVLVALVRALRHRAARHEVGLMVTLLAAGLLAPLDQSWTHTSESLQKHVDFGAWFAAMAAGFLLSRLIAARLPRVVAAFMALVIAALAAAPTGYEGVKQARALFAVWPNSSALVAAIKPYVKRGTDRYLVEDDYVTAYYLRDQSSANQWSDTFSAGYTDPGTGAVLTGAAAFREEILLHRYKLIVLSFSDTAATDVQIARAITVAGGYRKIARIPNQDSYGAGAYDVWVYDPSAT